MSWDKTPPTKAELANSDLDWASAPPTQDELGVKASKLDSAVRKGAQGLIGSLSDEAVGAGEALGAAVGLKGGGKAIQNAAIGNTLGAVQGLSTSEEGPTLDWEVLKEAYKRARDKERADLKKDSKDNPKISAAAEIAGAIISPINKIMPGASFAKQGAATGAIMGIGASEGETVGQVAKDGVVGGLFGGVLGKGADMASPLIQKGVEKIASGSGALAKDLAARAIGAERGTLKKLKPGQKEAIGEFALENKLFSPFSNATKMTANNEAAKKAAMAQRKAAYNVIDDSGASAFSPLDAAAEAEMKVLAGRNPNYDDTKELKAALEPHLQNILSRGDDNIPMSEAQKLVESLGEKANFDSTRSKTANKVAKDVYNSVREAINNAAKTGADSIGIKGVKKTIEEANKQFATGMKAGKLLENRVAREGGNNLLGLTDHLTLLGGASYGGATGDWETAGATFLAKRGFQKYGMQNAALAANKISKTLAQSPKFAALLEKNPAAFNALVNRFEKPGAIDALLPAAAKNEEAPKKGPEKWANDGKQKLIEHDPSLDAASVDALMKTKKGKDLLIRASDLKPKSKAMEKLKEQIRSASLGSE